MAYEPLMSVSSGLSVDSRGRAVIRLQRLLAGLETGEIPTEEAAPGVYGPYTKRLVAGVQARLGLTDVERGVVGEQTARALNDLALERGLLFAVEGRVFDENGNAADGIPVFVTDLDNSETNCATAVTNVDGYYRAWYDPKFYAYEQPDVTRPKEVIDLVVGSGDVRTEPIHDPASLVGVDLRIATSGHDELKVRGTVVDTRGRPVPRALVVVFDREIGQERTLLGRDSTSAAGEFTVGYRRSDIADGDAAPFTADLVFEAYVDDRVQEFGIERLPVDDEDIIAAPLPVPDDELVLGIVARTDELVKLTLTTATGKPAGPSEFARVTDTLAPLTRRVPVADFDETGSRDISFAARETGLDYELISAMVDAHRLAAALGEETSPEATYAIIRHVGRRDVRAVAATTVPVLADGIEKGIESDTIGPLDEAATTVADRLRRRAVNALLSREPGTADGTATAMRSAVADPATRASVLSTLLENRDSNAWAQIRAQHPDVDVDRVQYSLQLTALVEDDTALFQAIVDRFPDVTSMRTLTRSLDDETIADVIETIGALPPDTESEESPAAARQRLAKSIRRLIDVAHPTAAVARTISEVGAAAPGIVDRPTTGLLDRLVDTDIDIAVANLSEVVGARPDLFADTATDVERAQALAGAQRVQRLFRVTADAGELKLLSSAVDNAGRPFAGATDVARLGKAAFLARFPGVEPSQLASLESLHSRARNIADTVANLLIGHHQDLRRDQISTDASGLAPSDVLPEPNAEIRSWTEVFGSEEQCECDECRSVIGPAAYLVDLFEFLDKRCPADENGITLLDRLIGNPAKSENGIPIVGRRPDLAHIKLTCQNVNTTIPTIDLINEILESVIAYGSVVPLAVDADHQVIEPPTVVPNESSPGVTGPELAAAPEHVVEDAYLRVAEQSYPICLPYDRLLDTARTWLRQAGVDRADALRAFLDPAAPATADVIAAETLGLYRRDWEIITGVTFGGSATTVPATADLYGVAQLDSLTSVRQVLTALDISFDELTQVLRASSIGGLVPDADDPGIESRLLLTLGQLGDLRDADYVAPAEIQRALDLGGITGEDVRAFDAKYPPATLVLDPSISCDPDSMSIAHLDGTAVTPDEWLRIHRFVRTAKRSGIEPADLDVALHAVSPSAGIDAESLRGLAALALLRESLDVSWPVAAAVVAAIGTAGQSNLYDTLFVDSGLARVHPELRRSANGSVLAVPVSLEVLAAPIALVLGWKPTDLSGVAELLEVDAVSITELSALHRIAVLARAVGIAPTDMVRLDRILRADGGAADPASTMDLLIRARRLVALNDVATLEPLITEPVLPAEDDPAAAAATAALDAILTTLSAPASDADEPVDDVNPNNENGHAQQSPEDLRKLIVAAVADRLSLAPALAKQIVDVTTSLKELSKYATADEKSAAEAELIRIARFAAAILGLGNGAASVGSALRTSDRSAVDALSTLIVVGEPGVRLAIAEDIALYAALVERFGGPTAVVDAVAAILDAPVDVESRLAAWLQVDKVTVAAGRAMVDPALPPLHYLDRIASIVRISTKAGTGPAQISAALAEPVTQAALAPLETGIASNYSASGWLDLSKQLTDPIRERSRDALVAYLKHWGPEPITTDEELFARYLVDVGMDSFTLTSRIRQATFAIHSYVQRCQLGAEGQSARTQINSAEWEVVGNYAVWASRMQTLLWPEQILDPRWRDDKSPAFRELESAVRQGDLTDANVRRALEQYLDSMAVTSSLEICGTYLQENFSGADEGRYTSILHVVGRTRSVPRRYFYRRLEKYPSHDEWTDWEPVQVDIDGIESDRVDPRQEGEVIAPLPQPGVHVLPVVWQGSLHLFWPTFARKVQKPKPPADIDTNNPKITTRFSTPYWEIKLNSTRRDPAGWTAKTQWPPIVEPWMWLFKRRIPSYSNPESFHLLATRVDSNRLELSLAKRISRGEIAPRQDRRLFSFVLTSPHAEILTIDRERQKVAPADHPEWKGALTDSYQAMRVGGELTAVSADNPNGDRILSAPSLRISGLSQEFPDPLRAPLFLDLGDTVYFARTQPGTAWIRDDSVFEMKAATVLGAVQNAAHGVTAIDLGVGTSIAQQKTLAGGVSSSQTAISSVKAAASQMIKTTNPWLAAPAISAATSSIKTSPSKGAAVGNATEIVDLGKWIRTRTVSAVDLIVSPFSNPFVAQYQSALRTGGVDALYDPELQQLTVDHTFVERCQPSKQRVTAPEVEQVDFAISAPCGRQHWELFFHVPGLLQKLMRDDKQLDGALAMIRRIYDPFSPVKDANDMWRFQGLRDAAPLRIDEILASLSLPEGDERRASVEQQIDQMRMFPFQGHRIARLRPIAYKRWLVTEFVTLLIDLSDRHHRAFTPEDVNRSFLYCLTAKAIMGPAPQRVRPRAAMAPRSYAELRPLLDKSGNVMLEAETILGAMPITLGNGPGTGPATNLAVRSSIGYFGIPRNKKLHALWDLVDDRLFKLRHGMNIDGVRVQLPLFLPPIDPAILAEAVGSGLSLSEALSALAVERPKHRFALAYREALAAAEHLVSLGEALLQAHSQRDTEALARLSAIHQKILADRILDSRKKQVEAAAAELEEARKQLDAPMRVWRYYKDLLGLVRIEPPSSANNGFATPSRALVLAQSGDVKFESLQLIPELAKGATAFILSPTTAGAMVAVDTSVDGVTMAEGTMLNEEKYELEESFEAIKLGFEAARYEALAGMLGAIPNFEAATKPMGAGVAVHMGGQLLSGVARAAAGGKNAAGGMHRFLSQVYAKQASLVLREHEWVHGLNQAAEQIHQVNKRIAVAELRLNVAEEEQKAQTRTQQNAEQIQAYLNGQMLDVEGNELGQKFTTQELFDQRIDKLNTLFQQVADIAYDQAKQAEACYRFEREPTSSPRFVKVGPVASAKEHLLYGHELLAALREMNRSYLETAHDGPQLTKHVSLREIAPAQLHTLRETGAADFTIDELWFDLDHPAHYDRRISTVSITIPCVTGPLSGVGGTLTLTGAQRRRLPSNETGLEDSLIGTPSVALSSGRDDSGRFELRADDPLYNPFEGFGAISKWALTLPQKLRTFDYRTIADVVLTIRYTAESGGPSREQTRVEELKNLSRQRLISARHDHPDAWAAFHATGELVVPAANDLLPYVLHYIGGEYELAESTAYALLRGQGASASMDAIPTEAGDGLRVNLGAVAADLDDVVVLANFVKR